MTATTPDERSAQLLFFVEVTHALCDLRRIDRAALRLVYWAGYTQQQTATVLGVPTHTVRAAIARGMRDLAASIENGRPAPAQRPPTQ